MSYAQYPRRILLSVMGMTPQVLTETLYALWRQGPQYLPTEICIVTTTKGRLAVLEHLLGESGQFAAFCREYDLVGQIPFDARSIEVLGERDGAGGLEDIRSEEDNLCLADTLVNKVADLTRDVNSALHVSIAGGRKTMGSYALGALTMLGRRQDVLSHVLVGEAQEKDRTFFFPLRQDSENVPVSLAMIPFVRMRDVLSEAQRTDLCRYEDAVRAAQEGLGSQDLTIDLERGIVLGFGYEISLPDSELITLLVMAEQRIKKLPCITPDMTPKDFQNLYNEAYERCGKDWRLAHVHLKSFDVNTFRKHRSTLRSKLVKQLGEQRVSLWMKMRFGKAPYDGLLLLPSQIHIADRAGRVTRGKRA